MTTAKEQLYDEKMSPLMSELIRLAKEHDIPMFASFQLNDSRPCSEQDDENPGFLCTTSILPADAHQALHACYRQLRQAQDPHLYAFTVVTTPATAETEEYETEEDETEEEIEEDEAAAEGA